MLDISKKDIKFGIKVLFIALFTVFVIRNFLFIPILVQGGSMEPTIHDGEILLVNRMNSISNSYERFDIIVFKKNKEDNYVKRIIGVEGDLIEYRDDMLFINGKMYEEPYLEEEREKLRDRLQLTEDFTIEEYLDSEVVPEGHVFVLGDNRINSDDSRNPAVGFVPVSKIIGKCSSIYKP